MEIILCNFTGTSLPLVKLSIQISKISSCELFVSLEIESGVAMYKLMMMMMNCSCDMVDRKIRLVLLSAE